MKNKIIFITCTITIIIGIIYAISTLGMRQKNRENYINPKEENNMKNERIYFDKIKIDIKMQNVEIIPSEDGSYGYEIDGNYKSTFIHEIKDSTLYIKEKLNHLYRLLFFNLIYDYFNGLNKVNIRIYAPKDAQLNSINLKNSSGKSHIKNIKSKSLELKSTSGNISLANINVTDLKSKQTSGELAINKCIIEKSLEIHSTSNNIFITKTAAKKLKIKKTSGKTNIQHSKISKCEMNNTSGSFNINKTDINGLKTSTTSGKILYSGVLTGKTELKSTSGSITLDINAEKEKYSIFANPGSGNLYIDEKKQNLKEDKEYNKGKNGDNEIDLKTTSGDASINFHK